MFVAAGGTQAEALAQQHLDVHVGGLTLLRPAAGLVAGETGRAVGVGFQAGGGAGTDGVGGRIAGLHRVGFLAELGTEGDVDRSREAGFPAVVEVGIGVLLGLRQTAQVERGRAAGAQRRIDRIAQPVVDFVAAIGRADVPAEIRVEFAAHTAHQLQVMLLVGVLGAEADRIDTAQVPAGEDRRGAVGARGGVRVAPVEVADPLAVSVQAEGVQLGGVVDEGFQVEAGALAFQIGLSPALDRVGHAQLRVRGLERDCIRPLAGARSGVGVGEFGEQDQAAVIAQRQAAARAHLAGTAIALRIAGIANGDLAAGFVFQDDVDDAGNRIGAVLRRRAIAQHFDALDRAGRNLRQIGGLRTAAAQQRAAVEAAAIDQYQRLVRRQATQRGGAHNTYPSAIGRRWTTNDGTSWASTSFRSFDSTAWISSLLKTSTGASVSNWVRLEARVPVTSMVSSGWSRWPAVRRWRHRP